MAVLCLAGPSPPASAIDSLDLQLGSLDGAGWQAQGIALRLQLEPGAPAGVEITVRRLRLEAVAETFDNIRISCPEAELSELGLVCKAGRLSADDPKLQHPTAELDLFWDRLDDRLELDLRALRFAGGRIDAHLIKDADRWRTRLRADAVALSPLRVWLAPFLPTLGHWTLQGALDLTLESQAERGRLKQVTWDARIRGVGFSDSGGTYLAQGVDATARGRLESSPAAWSGTVVLEMRRGEVLTPLLYLAPEGHPVNLAGNFRWQPKTRILTLDDLKYRHPEVLTFDASASVDLGAAPELLRLRLVAEDVPLDALYGRYAQPVLGSGVLAELALTGTARVQVDYGSHAPGRIAIDLEQAGIEGLAAEPAHSGDEAAVRRLSPFGVRGLQGRLVWTRDPPGEMSTLRWRGGHLLEKVALGTSELDLRFVGDRLEMSGEATLPVMDGSLLVHRFSFSPATASGGGLEFEGTLTPVSMREVSEALDWPVLSGKLSGVIPSVALRDGSLEVEGNLLVRAFDGDILVRNLRMDDLFGVWPVVTADIELKNLDLEMLTGTFAFGKITGRLEGRAEGLRLENWSPVAFDARFATPEDDKTRHRISQKAVDNIADLGGAGVSGAVSRGVLRYFDEFGYRRLGISCRLRNGVCEMGGLSAAGEGYYLIEGGGVPRIEIIGFNRRTDWDLLLRQLKEIAGGQAPVIE